MAWVKDFRPERASYLIDASLHKECVPKDTALQFVTENHWPAIENRLRQLAADEWFTSTKPYLLCLNIVCSHDKDHVRDGLRRAFEPGREDNSQITEYQLLGIATDVARFLESLPPAPAEEERQGAFGDFCRRHVLTPLETLSQYAEPARLSDAPAWAEEMVRITRMFRELLFGIAWPVHIAQTAWDVKGALKKLNGLLVAAPANPIVFVELNRESPEFARESDPEQKTLETLFAEWIADYLVSYQASINLAVCTECGRIFRRERRDNLYCSKTCQNHVAYKRKRIFESGLLDTVTVDPDAPDSLRAGLWLHHPRFGLGVVKKVDYWDRRVRVRYKDGSAFTYSASMFKESTSNGREIVSREELVDPRSVRATVQFLAIAREFGYNELFPAKRSESVPVLYAVRDLPALIDLL